MGYYCAVCQQAFPTESSLMKHGHFRIEDGKILTGIEKHWAEQADNPSIDLADRRQLKRMGVIWSEA